MTGAERAKKHREKVKMGNKCDEFKKKEAERMKQIRAKKKQTEDEMNTAAAHAVIMKRRAATLERVQKHRKQAKSQNNVSIDNQRHESNLAEIVGEAYKSCQTLAKAVKKVKNALPTSPRKKKAVLSHIVSNLDEVDKGTVIDVVTNRQKYTRKCIPAGLSGFIRNYFERDDISRMSPNTKDVKKYKCPETGEDLFLPTRHMLFSVKEAHALFVEEMKSEGTGMTMVFTIKSVHILMTYLISTISDACSLSLFQKNRPEHIKLINKLPHNLCLCSYHANFMEAVNALNKIVPNVPSYENGFVAKFLCEEPSKDCWFGECNKCCGVTVDQLRTVIGEVSYDQSASWFLWEKDKKTN